MGVVLGVKVGGLWGVVLEVSWGVLRESEGEVGQQGCCI